MQIGVFTSFNEIFFSAPVEIVKDSFEVSGSFKENSFIGKWVLFFTHDLWVLKIGELPPKKSFFIKLLRVFTLSVRGFLEDHCSLRASALTFYSILSIVPLMALFFGE